MVRTVAAVLIVLAWSVWPHRAVAQTDPGPMVTDRPDQTESTEIVPRGYVQFEAGWTFAREAAGAVAVEQHAVPQSLARIGVAPRVELRLGFAGWMRTAVEGIGPTAVESGMGDLDVGFKWRLADGSQGRPSVALVTAVALPTGAEGFGGERLDPTVRLAFAQDLTDRIALGYNVGAVVSSAPDGAGGTETFVDALYTVAFGFTLAERVGAFAEAFGTFAMSGGASKHSLDGGFTFPVADNLQFDVSGGVGLNAAAADWFVGAGVAVRVPR